MEEEKAKEERKTPEKVEENFEPIEKAEAAPEADPNAYGWYNPAGWFGTSPEATTEDPKEI